MKPSPSCTHKKLNCLVTPFHGLSDYFQNQISQIFYPVSINIGAQHTPIKSTIINVSVAIGVVKFLVQNQLRGFWSHMNFFPVLEKTSLTIFFLFWKFVQNVLVPPVFWIPIRNLFFGLISSTQKYQQKLDFSHPSPSLWEMSKLKQK